MLIDSNELQDRANIKTQICIIGAGAAGITIANELANSKTSVALMESGSLSYEAETQSLYRGKTIGVHYKTGVRSRLRFFGGSTNHWRGYCRPIEDNVFEKRAWIPKSGWPLSKEILTPFYKKAQELCQLGPYIYDAHEISRLINLDCSFLSRSKDLYTGTYQLSPPTQFGYVYRNKIFKADNIDTYIYANAYKIELHKDGRSVKQVSFKTLKGKMFSVTADYFILGLGGIENVRLLLFSNDVQKEGIGNRYDLVGRYFMDHPKITLGALLGLDWPYYMIRNFVNSQVNNQSLKLLYFLSINAKTAEREQMCNLAGLVSRVRVEDPKVYASFLEVFANSLRGKKNLNYVRRNIRVYQLRCLLEQTPNENSRVTLSQEKDKLGQNKVVLDWRINRIDKETLLKFGKIFAKQIAAEGVGRYKSKLDFDVDLWSDKVIEQASHHMGTTRMDLNEHNGVVDPDGKVHGVENLYISGSSVFPCCGFSNPTLTIVALAARLAQHIKTKVT